MKASKKLTPPKTVWVYAVHTSAQEFRQQETAVFGSRIEAVSCLFDGLDSIDAHCVSTPQEKKGMKKIRALVEKGDFEKASDALNNLFGEQFFIRECTVL